MSKLRMRDFLPDAVFECLHWDVLWQFFQVRARTKVFGNFGSLVGCMCLPGASFHSKTIVLI